MGGIHRNAYSTWHVTQIEFSFSNKLFLIHLQIYVNEILNFNKLS